MKQLTAQIIGKIRDGQIHDDFALQKLVIASIPFCRNIVEYLGDDATYRSLTALLHIKPSTESTTLSDYWDIIKPIFRLSDLLCEPYAANPVLCLIFDLADKLQRENNNTVSLEDKLVLSIAIRLKSELYLRKVLIENDEELECTTNQTRTWMKRAQKHISQTEYDLLNTVGLITPESIHVNAFMYEPLIDVPNWKLFDLYSRVCHELPY